MLFKNGPAKRFEQDARLQKGFFTICHIRKLRTGNRSLCASLCRPTDLRAMQLARSFCRVTFYAVCLSIRLSCTSGRTDGSNEVHSPKTTTTRRTSPVCCERGARRLIPVFDVKAGKRSGVTNAVYALDIGLICNKLRFVTPAIHPYCPGGNFILLRLCPEMDLRQPSMPVGWSASRLSLQFLISKLPTIKRIVLDYSGLGEGRRAECVRTAASMPPRFHPGRRVFFGPQLDTYPNV